MLFFLICYPYILFHFLLLFMSLFQQQMHAWAEVCHLLQSSKSPLTGFLCSIGWRIIDQTMQAFFKHSLHTNSISNSAILHNNYILLLSDLCTCIHGKKKWRCKGSHSSSVSSSNCLVWPRTWKKAMGLVHCSVKNAAVLCKNHPERVTQI